jgi:hypothetical protein
MLSSDLSNKRKFEEYVKESDERMLRAMKLMADTVEVQNKNAKTMLENLEKAEELYTNMCMGKLIDNKTNRLFKESILDAVGITDDNQIGDNPFSTIENYLYQDGCTPTKQEVLDCDRIMAGLYRHKYGKDPIVRKQVIYGRVKKVNSYTEKDEDLMEQAVLEGLASD